MSSCVSCCRAAPSPPARRPDDPIPAAPRPGPVARSAGECGRRAQRPAVPPRCAHGKRRPRCGRSRHRERRRRRAPSCAACASRRPPWRRPRRPAGRRWSGRRRRHPSARNTTGGSSTTRSEGSRPKYIASITWRGGAGRSTGGRRARGRSSPPARPARAARTTAPSNRCRARLPSRRRCRPTAGKRNVRPSGATAEQLVPDPHTTATPHVRSVPARRTANVSLRTRSLAVHPRSESHRFSRRSSLGKSAPARQKTPRSVSGRRSGRIPASRAAASIACWTGARWPKARRSPLSGASCTSARRTRLTPRSLPSRPTIAASTFEPPPSTARIAGRRVTEPPRARPRRRRWRRARAACRSAGARRPRSPSAMCAARRRRRRRGASPARRRRG